MVDVWSIAKILERAGNLLQGKGYGAKTTEQEVKQAARFISERNDLTVIDVGGNIGDYSFWLRERWKNAYIHVFEPAAINVKKLEDRFAEDPRIRINPFGLSDFSQKAVLYSESSGSGLASLTNRRLDHFNIDFNVSESVDVIRFEDYWKSVLNEGSVDLVKLDIEGHELKALEGFGMALNHVGLVQFEFGGCNLDTKTSFQDFYYFFKDAGFSLCRITPLGIQRLDKYRESDEVYLTTNFIAVNERLK